MTGSYFLLKQFTASAFCVSDEGAENETAVSGVPEPRAMQLLVQFLSGLSTRYGTTRKKCSAPLRTLSCRPHVITAQLGGCQAELPGHTCAELPAVCVLLQRQGAPGAGRRTQDAKRLQASKKRRITNARERSRTAHVRRARCSGRMVAQALPLLDSTATRNTSTTLAHRLLFS